MTTSSSRRAAVLATLGALAALPCGAQPTPVVSRPATNDSGDAPLSLSEFVVSTERDRGYYSGNAAAGSVLANTALKDLSMSIQVLNRQFLDDLQPTDIKEALQFASAWNPDTGQIRGLDALGADAAGTGRSGFGTNGLTEAGGVERIEVMKGPTSLLFGSSNPGGTINAIPKRPTNRNWVETEVMYGNFQQRYRLETNYVLNNRLRTRLGLQYSERSTNNDTPSNQIVIGDHDYDKRHLLFSSTIYRPFQNTEVILDFEYLRGRENRGDRTSTRFATVTRDGASVRLPWYLAYNVPLTWSISGPDAFRTNDHYYLTGAVNQKITPWLTSETNLWYQWRNGNNLRNVSVEESTTGPKAVRIGNYNVSTNDQRTTMITQRFLTTFDIGESKHRLVVRGVKYDFYNDSQTFRAYVPGTNPITGRTAANEVKGPWLAIEGVSADTIRGYDLSWPAIGSYTWRYDQDNHDHPQRIQGNVIYQSEIPTKIGRFNVLSGIGYHRQIESYRTTWATVGGQAVNQRLLQRPKRTGSAPTAGLVYEPINGVSIYGQFAESFIVGNTQNSFQELLPNREGESKELGVKLDLWDRKLSGTFSVFSSLDFNRPINDPNQFNVNTRDVNGLGPRDPGFNANALAPNTPRGDNVALGEYKSEGFDADLIYQPWANLQISVATTIAEGSTERDPDPSNLGRPLTGASKKSYTGLVRYSFQEGALKGLAVGGAFRKTGELFLNRIKQTSALGAPFVDYYRPGKTTLNVFAKYNFKVRGHSAWVQLNGDNVLHSAVNTLNEVSFTNRLTFEVESPVTWRVTTGVRF
jgi:outer membrane receptor protein involved in Fe transport